MTDWLEEILNAAGELAGLENAGEILTPLLRKAGAVPLGWAEPVYVRHSALDIDLTQGFAGTGSTEERSAETSFLTGPDSTLQDLYRRSDTKSALQMLYARSKAESALQDLYLQVRETVRGEPVSNGGRRSAVVVREESPVAAGLSIGEFDRAVRRDSRRYDSGMSIY